jgi:NADH:ubiquinone oxidoreductase subunit 4 (subunit M)
MLLSCLGILPLLGVVIVGSLNSYEEKHIFYSKVVALTTSILNLILSLVIFVLFNNSTNQFQFVQEHYNVQLFDVYLGLDGVSIFFVLLTTIIMPIALLSN